MELAWLNENKQAVRHKIGSETPCVPFGTRRSPYPTACFAQGPAFRAALQRAVRCQSLLREFSITEPGGLLTVVQPTYFSQNYRKFA